MSRTIEINEIELNDLYVDKQHTMTGIADYYRCSRRTILNKLRKFNIPIRKHGLNIPSNIIRKQYQNERLTTQQIAKKNQCSRAYIENQLRYMNIPVDNRQRKFMSMYEHKLTQDQIELIKGTVLGDALIEENKYGGCRLTITHCQKQLNYLLWKKAILNDIVTEKYPEEINKYGTNSFSQGLHYRIYTITHNYMRKLRSKFYDNGVKKVEYFKLTPLSLAVWYYDDGDIHKRSKAIRLHTEGFDITSIQNLVDMLKDSFGISSSIVKRKINWNNKTHEYNIIYVNRKNANKLIEIVSDYQIPGMEYKINPSNNPVETQNAYSGVFGLKCPNANTPSAVSMTDDGIVHGPRKR